MVTKGLWTVICCGVAVSAAAGCGNGDAGSSNTNATSTPTAADTTPRATKTPAPRSATAVNGVARASLPDGYKIKVRVDIPQPSVEIDIADAQPGHALVRATGEGKLTFVNATPGRNTPMPIGLPPEVRIYYPAKKLPASARLDPDAPLGLQNCSGVRDALYYDGVSYCRVYTLLADIAALRAMGDNAVLSPNQSRLVPLNAAAGIDPLGIAEKDAPSIKRLVSTTRPGLVAVFVSHASFGGCDQVAVLTGAGKDVSDAVSC